MSVETERFLFCFHEMTSSTFPSFVVVFFFGREKTEEEEEKNNLVEGNSNDSGNYTRHLFAGLKKTFECEKKRRKQLTIDQAKMVGLLLSSRCVCVCVCVGCYTHTQRSRISRNLLHVRLAGPAFVMNNQLCV
jgi:hypothetical protein